MNFYEKTNFYPLLFILFLGCPLNSMWFKKMPKVKFSKAKTFMSLAATVATIKIKKDEYFDVDLKKIAANEQVEGKIEISQINCPSDALLVHLHNKGKEVCITSFKRSEQVTKIIKKILEKEREMAEDYYVFYHGQTGSHKVLQDLTTELMAEESPEKFSNFIALRDPKNFQEEQSAQHYLDQNYPNNPSLCYDENKKIRKHLLSVNLSLFGNIHWSGKSAGECSAAYFFSNQSAYEKSTKELLENFLSNYSVPKSYLQQIILMQEDIARHGNLIQICIPKKGVDFHAYTSQSLGVPIDIPLSAILERYPNQKDFEGVNYLQARIVLSSGILDPNSGVKMYQYSLADEKALSSYGKKLKTLASELGSEIVRPEKFKKEKAAVQAKYAYLKDEIDAEYAEWKKNRKKV